MPLLIKSESDLGRKGVKKTWLSLLGDAKPAVRSDARSSSAEYRLEEGMRPNFLSFLLLLSVRRDFSRHPRGGKRESEVRIRGARRRSPEVRATEW